MIVSPPRPARTGDVHMLFHQGPIPEETRRLTAETYPIGLYGVPGDQHNPCVFRCGDELKVVVRVWNGKNDRRTVNYVASVADDWTLLGVKEIQAGTTSVVRGPIRTPLALSLPQAEDLRVFQWRGQLWGIGATHDNGTPPRWIRQVLVELGSDASRISQFHVLRSSRYEKNWMPCVDGDQLRLVYSTDPLITIDVDSPAAVSAEGIHQVTSYVRGGTPLIPYDDGWLAIVHQVHRPHAGVASGFNPLLGGWTLPQKDAIAGDEQTVYLHHFAKFDKGLTDVNVGSPWYFCQPGIEFAAGLVPHAGGFVASFGRRDKECWLAVFGRDAVEETFSSKVDNA